VGIIEAFFSFLGTALAALVAGFLAPWPYNYWRLKRYGQSCH